MKFEIGKSYRRRDGGIATLKVDGSGEVSAGHSLVWVGDLNGRRLLYSTDKNGVATEDINSDRDIVSDVPIVAVEHPIEVPIAVEQFVNVYQSGDDGLTFGSSFSSLDDSREWQRRDAVCLGTLKLSGSLPLYAPKGGAK